MHEKIFTRVAAVMMLAASPLLTMAPVARAAKLTPEQQCQKARYEAAAKYGLREQGARAAFRHQQPGEVATGGLEMPREIHGYLGEAAEEGGRHGVDV